MIAETSLHAAVRSAFAALSQAVRLLKVVFPPGAPQAVRRLVAYRAEGEEAVCGLLRYRVQCLGDDDSLALKDIQGLPVGLSIGDDEGGNRWVCGVVTGVERILSDGAATVFELHFEDALGILAHRKTWRVFRELSVVQITEQILDEHRQANRILAAAFRFAFDGLQRSYPARAFTMQAGESDAAFLTRLWAQEGIAWHFRCSWEDGHPVHTLILADAPGFYVADSLGPVRFQRADATEARDTVNTWEARRTLAPGAVARGSFDCKTVRRSDVSEPSALDQGEAGDALAHSLVDYAYDPPRAGAGAAHLAQLGRSRILAHEFAAKGWSGESVVRRFAHGRSFVLVGHAGVDRHPPAQREFILTRLELTAANGIRLDPVLAHRLAQGWREIPDEGGGLPFYRNRFECVRSDVPIVPLYDPARVPRPGLLSAIVVGESGREVDVDEQGRIAVRFLFARDEEHPRYGTSGTPRDSARVRVLQPWADAGFGAAFWPRVGSEILIGFIQGHPDKPIALGGLYDGLHEPVRFSGKGGLPANGALSGLRSREFHGDGYNQLRFDDSGGQVGSQLFSSHAATQLNQGWLGTPRDGGKAEARGEGFELATHAAGALRAARGLLVSAFARLDPASRQLAREETLSLMEECVTLFRELGQYAADNTAVAADPAPQVRLRAALRDWEQGSSTAPGGGGGATPLVAITAPAGVHLSSPASIVSHAGGNLDAVALKHYQVSAAERLIANAGTGISLFAQSGGARFIAHQGPVGIQARHDDVTIEAARHLKLSASDGQLQALAAKEILLATADGCYLKLGNGRIELGCSGAIALKAARHDWSGPATQAAELPHFASADVGRTPVFVRPTDGQPIADARYEITRADGRVEAGVTDAEGRAQSITSAQFESLDVRFTPPET